MVLILGTGLVAPSARANESPTTLAESTSTAPARIDINHATVEELCTLPGIGKKRAEAIVEYRQHRPFTRLTQLMRIRGIGKRTLKRLKPYLTVGPLRVDGPRAKEARAGARQHEVPKPLARANCPEGERG